MANESISPSNHEPITASLPFPHLLELYGAWLKHEQKDNLVLNLTMTVCPQDLTTPKQQIRENGD